MKNQQKKQRYWDVICLKGIVQRKLSWLKVVLTNGLCFTVVVLDIFFLILKGHHFGICKNRFSNTSARIISNVWEN